MKEFLWKDKRYIAVSMAVLFALWGLASLEVHNEIILPSIGSTLQNVVQIIGDKDFLSIISASIVRCIESLVLSLAAAILIGIAASFSKLVYNFMLPITSFLKAVPTMGIVVLALIWLDSENAPKLIGFIAVFPILYESVQNGIFHVDPKILQMAQLYKASKFNIIMGIYSPSILMSLNHVINSAIGLCFKVVIAGEVLGQPKYSIGSRLQLEKMYLNTAGVFAWVIIIVALTQGLEILVGLLQKRLYRWV